MKSKRGALKGSSKEGSHVKYLIIKYVDVNMHTFFITAYPTLRVVWV